MASNLSQALYVVRLRFPPVRWTYHATVGARARRQSRDAPKPLRFFDDPPWHPPEGRESPREDWMSWRVFQDRYAYPGYVGMRLRIRSIDVKRGYGPFTPLYSLRQA